jgi:Ca2+-transporting ATPase
MVFSGTAATYGHGRAVVVATGMQTEVGRIATMLKEAPTETTPLQKELARVGRALGVVVVIIAIVMIATILLVENVRGLSSMFDVLLLGIALAVAAVPEGLPAVVTAVLSLGVQRMAKRNAIVRHLAAVETLGSATVIASDKTGTLTKNEMTVRVVVTASGRVSFEGTGYSPRGEVRREDGGGPIEGALRQELVRTLSAADRANNAVLQEDGGRWTVQGDPTEGALIVAARKAGLEAEALDARFGRVAEVPFSSERKLMSTIHTDTQRQERLLVLTKGAPDVLVARCSTELVGEGTRALSAERRGEIERINEELAGQALRTLAVAFRSLSKDRLRGELDARVEEDLVFLGLVGMIDPPREEAKAAVARAKGAGIRPIMITGDHPRTAGVIAAELGIAPDGRAVTGPELERMSDDVLERTVRDVSVYARVNPEHKLRIVQALQRQGATVAMTGDGVNDAPALKTADIGVAMGIAGSDVSKEAADMVLADDNFASIVAAVEVGRGIFSNIRKFLRYLLSSNLGEVMTMFLGVLLADVIGLKAQERSGIVLPLLATHILWINLVSDGAPALALGVDPLDHKVMNQPPRRRGEGAITRRMWVGILFVGAIMAAGTLLVLDWSLPGGLIEGAGNMRYAQTMAFTTLLFFSLFTVFNARSDEQSAFVGMFSNIWLWGAIVLSLVLQVAVIYVPFLQKAFSTVSLSAGDWLRCAAVGSSVLWLSELGKVVARARVSTVSPRIP